MLESNERGRIGEQSQSYRKGFVLGLTMAEVCILIIFILLLLLALGESRRESIVRSNLGKVLIDREHAERMQAADSTLGEIAEILGLDSAAVPDDFVRLVRILQGAVKERAAGAALTAASKEIEEMRRARQAFERVLTRVGNDSASQLGEELERQSYRQANQDGQLARLERALAAAGEGKGERPCWAQANGQIDYLYDVALTSRGIRMREYRYASRARERQLLPAPNVDPAELLSEAEFARRTRPLFLYSQRQNCRFFVVVYDGTAAHEKRLYKNLLRTVEGHFYKRLDNGRPPF